MTLLNILLLTTPLLVGIVVFTLHGLIRAVTAHVCGDKTIKPAKRLTLNPLKHLEPIGLVFFFFFGFGWGRPVETNPLYFRHDRKKAALAIAIIPLVSLFIFAGIFALVSYMMFMDTQPIMMDQGQYAVFYIFSEAARLTFLLSILNLIPIWPMDLNRAVKAVNPAAWMRMQGKEPVMQIVLIVLIIFGVLNWLFDPIVYGILRWL
ncbi:MAG: site-2 protease family protein [Defluviitaleaceae bacterium]|nr:site-2 protease family protein [Defluviitaleaceae bacterium]